MAEQLLVKSHVTNKWVPVSIFVAADYISVMTVDQMEELRDGKVVYLEEMDALVTIVDA